MAEPSGFDLIKDTPAWLQGVGTVIAFGWSVYLLRLDRAMDRKKKREDDNDFTRAFLLMLENATSALYEGVSYIRWNTRDDVSADMKAFYKSLRIVENDVDAILAPFIAVPMTEWPSYELHAKFMEWHRGYKDMFWVEDTPATDNIYAYRMDEVNRLALQFNALEEIRRSIEALIGLEKQPYTVKNYEMFLFDENGKEIA